MRTTVNLPDALMERAKQRAAEEAITLGELIESALQDRLLRPWAAGSAEPFELVTFGRGGLASGTTVEGLKHLEDQEQLEKVDQRSLPNPKANDAPT